jgi:hypothetical protein
MLDPCLPLLVGLSALKHLKRVNPFIFVAQKFNSAENKFAKTLKADEVVDLLFLLYKNHRRFLGFNALKFPLRISCFFRLMKWLRCLASILF